MEENDFLSFMDILDIDEELINARLESIMSRKTFTEQHLFNAIHLLTYKQLLNAKECEECENDVEFEFIGKLIEQINENNVDSICKILSLVLSLSPSTIIFKSEHLLQQLLSVSFEKEHLDSEDTQSELLLCLKLCDSTLEAVIKTGEKLCLPFLNVPLENIVISQSETLKRHFLITTVKNFFDGVTGYNILDRIWACIKQFSSEYLIQLNVLCALSDYYLPLPNKEKVTLFESNLISEIEFWNINLYGLSSKHPTDRKLAIYLIKRAIDCLTASNKDIKINSSRVSMEWKSKIKDKLKETWENFFILIDSLEEKQSNIVLPSLHLFSALKNLEKCWINCAFNIGLNHDNLEVKTKCMMHRLEICISSDFEAMVLLESLNDMNIFDHEEVCESIKEKFKRQITDLNTFIILIRNIPNVKWSPIPLYHLSTVLTKIQGKMYMGFEDCYELMNDLIKVPCNNVIIRKAFHKNLSCIVGNHCRKLSYQNILSLFNLLLSTYISNYKNCKEDNILQDSCKKVRPMFYEQENPLFSLIKDNLIIHDIDIFFEHLKKSHFNIDFMLIYLKGNERCLPYFLDYINNMLSNMKNRHISSSTMLDTIYLVVLFRKINDEYSIPCIKQLLIDRSYILINYVDDLFNNLNDDEDLIIILLENYQDIYNLHECPQICKKLHEKIINQLEDGSNIKMNICRIYLLNVIYRSRDKCKLSISLDDTIKILSNVNKINTKAGNGKLRNLFNSKACEVVYVISNNCNKEDFSDIIDFLTNALESGDRDCIRWILDITNMKLGEILKCKQFKITQFLRKIWSEIEAIKTNNEYSNCIEGFVELITDEELLKQSMYNNEVIAYCNKIIDYAMVKNMPLYYLVNAFRNDYVLSYGHMVYVFCEILLAVTVPRKDNRITDNLLVEISKEYNLSTSDGVFTTFHIEYKTIEVLGKIQNLDTLKIISCVIMKKIDDLFKNKQRYHRNSTLHRILHTGLQHLLYIVHRSNNKNDTDDIFEWCVQLLGKIPHQASTRLYLEWCISLGIYFKKINMADSIALMKMNSVPITSQFMILYWCIKKINSKNSDELKLVLDYLLENTMGPTYSIRLQAQYLISRINSFSQLELIEYKQAINVVNKTLSEASKLKEKSLERLKNDYFVHDFDIINDLTANAIYYSSHNEWTNEKIDENYAKQVFLNIGESCELKKFNNTTVSVKAVETIEADTIQKKYIPWNNMSDVGIMENAPVHKGDLIVVASLIDKLPNLGGMARTSEVFAVNTYVIDSLRHLQDKQFQGLSVSAERWVNVIEVRPGQPLKNYLSSKKAEGYTIIAAEQTSNSTSLQGFRFPKKTLLLLGNEKSGVPCDLLPHMDICVEIPQRGVLRSLNVHVTASIFIWEYTRQHM